MYGHRPHPHPYPHPHPHPHGPSFSNPPPRFGPHSPPVYGPHRRHHRDDCCTII